MESLLEQALSFLFGAFGGGVVAWFFQQRRSRWEAVHEAGLLALQTADAVVSNIDWRVGGVPVPVVKQPVDIANARKALNLLSLSCKSPAVVSHYLRALGVTTPSGKPEPLSADAIVDLRDAIRRELGFGRPLEVDRAKAFIANLSGAKMTGRGDR